VTAVVNEHQRLGVGGRRRPVAAQPVQREATLGPGRDHLVLAETHVPQEAYDEVAALLSPDEVAALLSLIVTINAWNAIAVTSRAWTPGSYQP
jgi:alkylhydroperoxidase family enzyme